MKYTVNLLIILLLLPLTAFGKKSAAAANSFASPDFAFPQTVIANAETALDKAVNNGNELNQIQALIQLTIAHDDISTSNAPDMLKALEKAADKASPAAAAIINLVQARLLEDIYQANRRQYNQRTLPLDSFPADPQLWSKELFALRVNELISSAMASPEALSHESIDKWKTLFTNLDGEQAPFYPNLEAVLTPIAARILDTFESGARAIPFESARKLSPAEQVSATLRRINSANAALAESNPAWLSQAISPTLASLSSAERDQKLLDYYNRFADSPYAAEFLVNMTQPDKKLLQEAITRFPDYFRVNLLKNMINRDESAACKLTVDNSPVPGIAFTVNSINSSGKPLFLHLFKVTDNTQRNAFKKLQGGAGKWIASYELPQDTAQINCKPLDAGYYWGCLSASPNDDRSKLISFNSSPLSFQVTGLHFYSVMPDDNKLPGKLFVLSAKDGSPVKGADIILTSREHNQKLTTFTLTTDYNGLALLPAAKRQLENFNVKIKKGNDEIESYIYNYATIQADEGITASIYTSLPIYKPGNTCDFAIITTKASSPSEGSIAPDRKIQVNLINASSEKVDSLQLTTGKDGRATGSFTLPKDDMNGTYYIEVTEKNKTLGTTYIRVEEYRRPTFFVEIGSDKPRYLAGDSIEITGKVITYSGMPVANAEVTVKLNTINNWRRQSSEGSYAEQVKSDEQGVFTITLSTLPLKGTSFANSAYSLQASATSPAGETQQSESASFSIGKTAYIEIINPSDSNIEANDSPLIISTKSEGLDAAPLFKLFSTKNNEALPVLKGESINNLIKINASTLPSGPYRLLAYDASDSTVNATYSFILWRKSDAKPPVENLLWVPITRINAKPKERVELTIGSALPGRKVLMTTCAPDGKQDFKYLDLSAENKQITLEAPAVNEITYVYLTTMNNGQAAEQRISITTPQPEIELTQTTFRDHINAAGHESWSFTFTGSYATPNNIPVIASLYDASLNTLASMQWDIFRMNRKSSHINMDSYSPYAGSFYQSFLTYKPLKYPALSLPSLYTYNRGLYGMQMVNYESAMVYASSAPVMLRGVERSMSRKEMASAKMEANGAADAITAGYDEDSGEVAAIEADNTEENAARSNSLRPAEMPLALFAPQLSTDGHGTVTLSFDAPDFNTTWQLMLFAISNNLTSTLVKKTTVASKPVMVQVSAPRFLRTGDKAMLPATIYNNSAEPLDITAEISIFDPSTGQTIYSMSPAAQAIAPGASSVVSIDFSVPDNMEFIGYRVIGKSGNYSDGEQSLIAILPSSSPVTESHPFYLAPAQNSYSTTLPAFDSQAMVALKYCDNPVWQCVTALPALSYSQNASVLSQANVLFGNAMAAGLVNRYPQIAHALELWSSTGDSTLVSNLERNPELKIAALDKTPWVLNAQSETLRMQGLKNLLDNIKTADGVNAAVQSLASQQAPDGGWSWCPGMKSSFYITEQVLATLGMLNDAGFLPQGADTMQKKAIAYCDKELLKIYNRDKDISTSSLLDYFYIRSLFRQDCTGDIAKLEKLAITRCKDEWKDFSIAQAAKAAILLNREKYNMGAREILESLSQRASKSEERGMWFDNLRNSYSGSTLSTTALVLRAYSEISPANKNIDALRQWLLIEREAQDWGRDSQIAEVIYSILSSGSDWTASSAPAQFMLNNTPLATDATDALTGAFTLFLNPKDASGATLTINRTAASPAWGATLTRYIAPIESVKDFSESDVTITKRILLVTDDKNGKSMAYASGSLTRGQHVKVQLTVTSKRDIDYAVITDEQAGCLAPSNQLSGYTYTDAIGYYREMRTGVTNLFIPRLPKGKFLIEYDCYVEGEGTYALGIATLQSLYAPELSAHSAGTLINVTK